MRSTGKIKIAGRVTDMMPKQHFWENYPYMTVTLFAVFISFFLMGNIFWSVGHLYYMDTDCYTRAQRVFELLSTGQWAEKLFPYGNPPTGFNLHFTRAVDVIWALLCLPFMLFMPIKEAIFYSGFLLSPLFYIFTVWMLVWCYETYLPKQHQRASILVPVTVFSAILLIRVIDIFHPYRPDHHSLADFILMFNAAAVLCSYNGLKLRYFFVAGCLSALDLWACSAIEGLVVFGCVLTVLSYDWLCGQRAVKDIAVYSFGMLATTTLFWVLNPPFGGWSVLENTRLSIIHVVLCALIFLAFAGIAAVQPKTVFSKIGILSGAAVISLLLMVLIFGWQQLTAPIYEEHIKEYFLPYVNEMLPIWDYPQMAFSILLSAVMLAVMCYRYKKFPFYLRDLALFMLLFTILSCAANRFHWYFVPLYVLTTGLFAGMLTDIDYAKSENRKYKFISVAFVLITIGYMSTLSVENNKMEQDHKDLEIASGHICLANIFEAPRLIFEKEIDVVGSPYHSNIEGIISNREMWMERDEAKLLALLKKYNVSCIIKPQHRTNFRDYPWTLSYKIVSETNIYPWLVKQDGYYLIDQDKL
ncbi:MAG: hypothetical protein J6Y91_00720 [Alphaproteobacteria bacterium]|nr:hypothetical protein [Alphaproteobacteria bacterium]